MKIRDDVNEYGTPISYHKCEYCGVEFSVCPAFDNVDGCSVYPCQSYDPKHDIDIIFMSDKELANHAPVVDIEMLRKRKDYQNGVNVFEVDND